MSKRRFQNVWDAIEESPNEAASMRARAELMNALIELIRQLELTQAEAAKRLGVTQPRISDLMRGKIDLFSLDMLFDMLALAGRRVDIKVKRERTTA